MRRLWVVVPVLLAGVLLGSSPAYAHVKLTSSSPSDGSTEEVAPTEITLTFNEEINPQLAEVAATVDGRSVEVGDVTVKDTTVTAPLPGEAGKYRVTYRVVGPDGHPIDGQIRFTAEKPAQAGTTSSAKPSTLTATKTEPAAKDRTVTRSWVWPLVGLGGVILLGGLAYVLISGRKRREDVTDRDGIQPTDSDPGRGTGD